MSAEIYVKCAHGFMATSVLYINSRLSSCFTVRASIAGFTQVSPTKVEACKSFIFTESSLVLNIKNT